MFDYWKNRRVSSMSRLSSRYSVSFKVLVKDMAGRPYDDVRDISSSGMCILTSSPLPKESIIVLQLEAPQQPTPIEVVGKVMWSKQDAMGVRFEQAERRILNIIDNLTKPYSY